MILSPLSRMEIMDRVTLALLSPIRKADMR